MLVNCTQISAILDNEFIIKIMSDYFSGFSMFFMPFEDMLFRFGLVAFLVFGAVCNLVSVCVVFSFTLLFF